MLSLSEKTQLNNNVFELSAMLRNHSCTVFYRWRYQPFNSSLNYQQGYIQWCHHDDDSQSKPIKVTYIDPLACWNTMRCSRKPMPATIIKNSTDSCKTDWKSRKLLNLVSSNESVVLYHFVQPWCRRADWHSRTPVSNPCGSSTEYWWLWSSDFRDWLWWCSGGAQILAV